MAKRKKRKIETVEKQEKEKEAIKKIDPPKIESTPYKFWKDENGELKINVDIPSLPEDLRTLFNNIVGVKDYELASHILTRGEKAISPFVGEEQRLNIIAQSLNDLKPKDAIEARLAVQAAVTFVYAMNSMQTSGNADMMFHIESMMNLAIKLMRVHNETIETLSKYRRGGEQRVIVTHVADKMAVVNNYGCMGGGGTPKNQGDMPCSENAEQEQEQTAINHAVSPQWPMDGAGCTEDCVQVQKRKQADSA